MIEKDVPRLPDLVDLLNHWWKKILLVVVLFTAVVAMILLIRPKEYLGVTTALPASEFASDKAGIFGENLQTLYSGLGTPDVLDKVVGTAKLDTLYASVVDQFDLVNNYELSDKKNARYRAIDQLKDDTRVIKSDYGELKVKVWHQSPAMAAKLSVAFMQELKKMHQLVQLVNNKRILQNIERSYQEKLKELSVLESGSGLKPNDSLLYNSSTVKLVRTNALVQQLSEYEKLMNQYNLVISTEPEVLVVVENAAVPVKHDRPDYFITILATIICSFVFAFLVVLALEKRRINK